MPSYPATEIPCGFCTMSCRPLPASVSDSVRRELWKAPEDPGRESRGHGPASAVLGLAVYPRQAPWSGDQASVQGWGGAPWGLHGFHHVGPVSGWRESEVPEPPVAFQLCQPCAHWVLSNTASGIFGFNSKPFPSCSTKITILGAEKLWWLGRG